MRVDQVQSFQIGDACQESFPCRHECTITLTNGTKKTVRMDGDEIYALANALPLNKIGSPGIEDFSVYSTRNLSLPASILSKIFNK